MRVNLSSWISRNAAIFPQKIALKDERLSHTYLELQGRVSALRHGLHSLGIQAGDRVAVLLPNCVEMVEILFACAHLGAIYVPLNWRLGEPELAFILNDCTPSVLVYHDSWKSKVEALQTQVQTAFKSLSITDTFETSEYEAFLSTCPATELPLPQGGGDDDLMILYTSGTTGDPKGVVLTHHNVFWQTINGWSLGTSPDAICLVLLPLFHSGGLNGSVTPILHIGATVVLQRKFEPGAVLAILEKEGITGVVGVPTIFHMLADHPAFSTTDLHRCEVLISGGAPLPESLIQIYHKRGLEFRQGYGLTEASPGVTGMGPGECLRKAGSAGRQILYTEVRLLDAHGQDVPLGESGEIIVRGPNVMRGYWKRPQETAQAIRDGWLFTGDIGRFDQEGFLYIVDRKKDMIISGGENIYPAEIEKLLAGHPEIQMAAVVAKPDPKWGELPVAAVLPRSSGLDEAALLAYLKEQKLAAYKMPRQIFLVAELPLNATGKVVKAELRKQLGLLS